MKAWRYVVSRELFDRGFVFALGLMFVVGGAAAVLVSPFLGKGLGESIVLASGGSTFVAMGIGPLRRSLSRSPASHYHRAQARGESWATESGQDKAEDREAAVGDPSTLAFEFVPNVKLELKRLWLVGLIPALFVYLLALDLIKGKGLGSAWREAGLPLLGLSAFIVIAAWVSRIRRSRERLEITVDGRLRALSWKKFREVNIREVVWISIVTDESNCPATTQIKTWSASGRMIRFGLTGGFPQQMERRFKEVLRRFNPLMRIRTTHIEKLKFRDLRHWPRNKYRELRLVKVLKHFDRLAPELDAAGVTGEELQILASENVIEIRVSGNEEKIQWVRERLADAPVRIISD